jgi:hypothetical protein
MKKCIVAALAGYWIGKYSRRRELFFALLFPLPFIFKYFYD